MLVTEQMREEMTPLLGSESSAQLVSETELLGAAWDARESLSIVPFHELEPRWKVMRINGSSPLDVVFDSQNYALATTFGLSGDPSQVGLVPSRPECESSSRYPRPEES